MAETDPWDRLPPASHCLGCGRVPCRCRSLGVITDSTLNRRNAVHEPPELVTVPLVALRALLDGYRTHTGLLGRDAVTAAADDAYDQLRELCT